jgi:hypothetical protein
MPDAHDDPTMDHNIEARQAQGRTDSEYKVYSIDSYLALLVASLEIFVQAHVRNQVRVAKQTHIDNIIHDKSGVTDAAELPEALYELRFCARFTLRTRSKCKTCWSCGAKEFWLVVARHRGVQAAV